ncbi:MAG: hypothetical protein ACRDQ4_02930 [Pseudonocardiaceae bacterium]
MSGTSRDLALTRFDHEIRLYETFTENPPPVWVPELVHTDGHRVLVIEHIPGHPVDTERYPAQPLPATALTTVLDTIAGFNALTPPGGVLADVRLPRPPLPGARSPAA